MSSPVSQQAAAHVVSGLLSLHGKLLWLSDTTSLPTFWVVYLEGVCPSLRASVHSMVTMHRIPVEAIPSALPCYPLA